MHSNNNHKLIIYSNSNIRNSSFFSIHSNKFRYLPQLLLKSIIQTLWFNRFTWCVFNYHSIQFQHSNRRVQNYKFLSIFQLDFFRLSYKLVKQFAFKDWKQNKWINNSYIFSWLHSINNYTASICHLENKLLISDTIFCILSKYLFYKQ